MHSHSFRQVEETRIVWGAVVAAGGGWINSGPRGDKTPAVRFGEGVVSQVLESVGVQELGDLVGLHFLVEGKFKPTSKGTPYVTLKDPRRITFLRSMG